MDFRTAKKVKFYQIRTENANMNITPSSMNIIYNAENPIWGVGAMEDVFCFTVVENGCTEEIGGKVGGFSKNWLYFWAA